MALLVLLLLLVVPAAAARDGLAAAASCAARLAGGVLTPCRLTHSAGPVGAVGVMSGGCDGV